MQRIIMHLDMNSYFATVEQQANPLLRGKPIGVCAYLSENGAIIAASVEAKQYGVKTAMRVQDAKKLCPQIILVENEPAKYRHISTKLFSLLAEYSDNVSPYSIDEAFVDLTGWVKDFSAAEELAKKIKQRIRTEIGVWLKCSIGLSFTHWLAKFASEEQKPDGLTVILKNKKDVMVSLPNHDGKSSSLRQAQADSVETQADSEKVNVCILDTIFVNRPLQHATGIADKIESRLVMTGITNLYELQQADPQKLITILGKYGYYLWAHVNGIEIKGWIKQEGNVQKSIGHSYCVPKQGKDKEYLLKVLYKLCEKTGRRLRAKQLTAQTIMSGWSYVSGNGVWHRKKLPVPIFTTQHVFMHAARQLEEAYLTDNVRMLAVSVGNLKPFSPQLSFWYDDSEAYKLGQALDTINDTYGEYTVYPGYLFDTDKQAQDRIGFRKSVDVIRKL